MEKTKKQEILERDQKGYAAKFLKYSDMELDHLIEKIYKQEPYYEHEATTVTPTDEDYMHIAFQAGCVMGYRMSPEGIADRVQEIQGRCDRATPAKKTMNKHYGTEPKPRWWATHDNWDTNGGVSEVWNDDGDEIAQVHGHLAYGGGPDDNAEFIAHAREDVPWLLKRVKDLEGKLELEHQRAEKVNLDLRSALRRLKALVK